MTLLIVCALAVILNGQEEYVPQVQAAQVIARAAVDRDAVVELVGGCTIVDVVAIGPIDWSPAEHGVAWVGLVCHD